MSIICKSYYFTNYKEIYNGRNIILGFHGFVVPQELRDLDLTPDSPLEFFLPAFTGPGFLILMITAYLIETNNRILEKYAGARDIK